MARPIAIALMIAPDHDLEWQALLLAASVRQFVTVPVALYFCIEDEHLARLGQTTRGLIAQLGGVLRPLPTRSAFAKPYPIGNKMRACALDYDEERIVFLDSDMLFANPSDLGRIAVGDVALQQEIGQVWTEEVGAAGQWDHLYHRFDIDDARLEDLRGQAPKFRFPYFNAGVVSFARASKFGRTWLETAQAIDADPAVTLKRPWLDQIALPITVLRGGHRLRLLPPLVNKRPNRDILKDLILAHYHGLIMMRLSHLSRIADRCVRTQLGLRSLEHLLDMVLRNAAAAQAARLGGKAPFAKVFGERNTGTNLLETVLRNNFRTQPLVPRSEARDFLNEARNAFGSVEEHREASRDLLHQATLDTLFGWKHARPHTSILARLPRYDQTTILCIYKHPAFWLKSMHRRPYNEFHGRVPETFAAFLRAPFTLSERDMLPYTFSGTPLEIYLEKLRGYLELKRARPERTLIVPYETLLTRQAEFLKLLKAHFAPRWIMPGFPSEAVKPIDRRQGGIRTQDYQNKYAPEALFDGFDAAARAVYDAQCDPGLLAELDAVSCFSEVRKSA